MSHEGIRCVVVSHKGLWFETCRIVRNEDVG